jgi:hypothetical protein
VSKARPKPPDICPVCGEEVPRNALACPECGADHNSGWKEDADAEGLAGEDPDDFDYDQFLEDEFGTPRKQGGIKRLWWVTAVVLLFAFVLFYVLALS